MNSEGTGRNRRVHVIVSVLTELSFIARCGRPTLPDPLPALGRYADTSSMKFCIVRILSVVSARVGIVILVAVGTLSPGCMVGPDFRLPTVPNTTEYTATPMPQETASALGTGGAMQDFLFGQEIPDQWWTLFQSKALDGVIRQAMADSPTLAAARSTLRQAQEKWRAQFGTLFPTVDVSASASREKISGAEFGEPSMIFPPFALFNASVTVSYALDFFGGTRRELETLQSQVDYQSFQLEGAYLTLTANIVTTAVREASLRSQIRATQEILAVQEKQLELVEQQLHRCATNVCRSRSAA